MYNDIALCAYIHVYVSTNVCILYVLLYIVYIFYTQAKDLKGITKIGRQSRLQTKQMTLFSSLAASSIGDSMHVQLMLYCLA